MHRRRLLKLLHAALAAGAAAALAWPVLSFVTWRPSREREVRFDVEDQVPLATSQGVCLVPGEQGLMALDMRCTHLCCLVAFDRAGGVFRCPCHRSVYDRQGRRLSGPAREDLRRLPAELAPDGTMVVRVPV